MPYDPARNAEVVARFKNESAGAIARDLHISRTRVLQIVKNNRDRSQWYHKIPTAMRNGIVNALYFYDRPVGSSLWDRPELEVVQMVARLSEKDLLKVPNVGLTTILRIQDWLDEHGLKLKTGDEDGAV